MVGGRETILDGARGGAFRRIWMGNAGRVYFGSSLTSYLDRYNDGTRDLIRVVGPDYGGLRIQGGTNSQINYGSLLHVIRGTATRHTFHTSTIEQIVAHAFNDKEFRQALLVECRVKDEERATPLEGDLTWDSVAHKLQVYNGSAWETVTSA